MQKTILITGATSGIGKAAAESIAQKGHRIVFTARNQERAILTKDELFEKTENNEIEFLIVDFASFQSIKKMAEAFKTKYDQLDVLINNAGVWETERNLSSDGIEMNFAVNHLAPFLLTHLLLPVLKQSDEARIVNTSSMAHRRNILYLEDLEFKSKAYDGISTYSQSKLCNILFTLHLADELKETNVTVNTVHPGYVQSNLFKNMEKRDWSNVPDAYDGARSTLYAALSHDMKGISGKYIFHEKEEEPTEFAKNKDLARRLYEISLDYVKNYL
jgi:NAD(P)-dependent dehydrogenase (short-subunit alcohol dehydrogenase family)